jgi:hypothetical protein
MGHVQAPLQFFQYSVYELHEQVRAISELLQCIGEGDFREEGEEEGEREKARQRQGNH